MPTPAPADGTYDLVWTVPGVPPDPPSTQRVTYVVKAGVIETTFGALTWDTTDAAFAHASLIIGLSCTGAGTFTGVAPGNNVAGTCTKRP